MKSDFEKIRDFCEQKKEMARMNLRTKGTGIRTRHQAKRDIRMYDKIIDKLWEATRGTTEYKPITYIEGGGIKEIECKPVVDTYFMPEWVRDKLDDEANFYKDFASLLDKNFPSGWKDDYFLVCGSDGWIKAFKDALSIHQMDDVKNYYINLDWTEVGPFDSELEKLTIRAIA